MASKLTVLEAFEITAHDKTGEVETGVYSIRPDNRVRLSVRLTDRLPEDVVELVVDLNALYAHKKLIRVE